MQKQNLNTQIKAIKFSIIILMIPVIFLAIPAFNNYQLQQRGVETSATVLEINTGFNRRMGGVYDTATVVYEANEILQMSYINVHSRVRTGDVISIIYDPANPQTIAIPGIYDIVFYGIGSAALLIVVIVLLIILMRLSKRNKEQQIHDYPCPFRYKAAWYAIKGETPLAVIEKLNLSIVRKSNWESGLEQIHSNNNVFVSPSIDGFVLVIDFSGLSINDDHYMVMKHARLFAEFYYFGSHRTVDYYAWAKFINGELIRAYSYVGETGDITWNEGRITNEELELGFDKFPIVDDSFNDDTEYPDEGCVIDIANLWSINPASNTLNLEKSTGYICKLNNTD